MRGASEKSKLFNKEDEKGNYKLNNYIRLGGGDQNLKINKPNFFYPIYVSQDLKSVAIDEKEGYHKVYPINSSGQERTWKSRKETTLEKIKTGDIVADTDSKGNIQIFEKHRENQVIKTHWIDTKYNAINQGTKLLDDLFGKRLFDFPKPLPLIQDILKLTTKKDDIVLDFFPGSATTAHAVMQQNVEDRGNRKYIMIQLPEKIGENEEAYQAGYRNIAELARERIRRAGKKIQEDYADTLAEREQPLDLGFRAYYVDDSNMKDVYYEPENMDQQNMLDTVENIKKDRSGEDLLTQVMLDLGLRLDLPIETKNIRGFTVYDVAKSSLIASFDTNIDAQLIEDIAKEKPLKAVFRDASFQKEEDRTNLETTFKRYSPDTMIKVL